MHGRFRSLLSPASPTCLSVLIPLDPSGTNPRRDRLTAKNLLREAEGTVAKLCALLLDSFVHQQSAQVSLAPLLFSEAYSLSDRDEDTYYPFLYP